MGSQNLSMSMSLFLISCFLMISSSLAYTNFYVGGDDGWVVQPSESYNHWAERLRFLVNDTLVFKYKEGKDSVLEVSEDDYYNCNTKKPLKYMTSGTSVFQFPHSGPFFFISGKKHHCEKGQKLIVLVLSPRPINPKPMPPSVSPVQPPSPSASPAPSSPHISPSSAPSTSPSPMPYAPTPSPSDGPSEAVAPVPGHHHSASTVVSASGVTLLGLTLFVSVAVLGVSL